MSLDNLIIRAKLANQYESQIEKPRVSSEFYLLREQSEEVTFLEKTSVEKRTVRTLVDPGFRWEVECTREEDDTLTLIRARCIARPGVMLFNAIPDITSVVVLAHQLSLI